MQKFEVVLVDMMDEVLQVALEDSGVREAAAEAETPESMVPLWEQPGAGDAPASNSTVD